MPVVMGAGLRLIRSGTQKQSLQILELKFYAGLFEPLPLYPAYGIALYIFIAKRFT